MRTFKSTIYNICFFALIAFHSIHAQTAKAPTPKIYNAGNASEIADYVQLALDETHPNLLDPRVARDDQKNVIASWTDLHQRIGQYLADNNFSWGTMAESISMYQKIYFNANGQITHYLFNIRNPDIPMEKKEEFGEYLARFAAENSISYAWTAQFAQCGKIRYDNKQRQ